MVPLMTVAMGLLTKEQMGNATGIFALARNPAASIGIALVTAFVTRSAQTHQAARGHPIRPRLQRKTHTSETKPGHPAVGDFKPGRDTPELE